MRPENEILIDYLDGQLNPEEMATVKHSVENQTATASELQYLKLAIETVRFEAINAKVSSIRESFEKIKRLQLNPIKLSCAVCTRYLCA